MSCLDDVAEEIRECDADRFRAGTEMCERHIREMATCEERVGAVEREEFCCEIGGLRYGYSGSDG